MLSKRAPLADAGCDLDTIRRVLGQKTLSMAQHYSDRAKRAKSTRTAILGIDPLAQIELSNPVSNQRDLPLFDIQASVQALEIVEEKWLPEQDSNLRQSD